MRAINQFTHEHAKSDGAKWFPVTQSRVNPKREDAGD